YHRHLHAFPTRRSSDLETAVSPPEITILPLASIPSPEDLICSVPPEMEMLPSELDDVPPGVPFIPPLPPNMASRPPAVPLESVRSEEHTSELQSRFDLV